MVPVCTNDISLPGSLSIPFSYLNDSTCFMMRVSAIKSRHCIYHGRQCTVDRRSYSVLNMVRNFWNMCSTVEDDMWSITSIQLGITCHGSMTILKESNANERPSSPLVLTHTPPLVPAIPSLSVPFLPCFNPLISWFSSLQLCILQSGSLTIRSCFLHSTFDYVPFSQHQLFSQLFPTCSSPGLYPSFPFIPLSWFLSMALLRHPKVFSLTSYLSVHLTSDLLPPTFSSP